MESGRPTDSLGFQMFRHLLLTYVEHDEDIINPMQTVR